MLVTLFYPWRVSWLRIPFTDYDKIVVRSLLMYYTDNVERNDDDFTFTRDELKNTNDDDDAKIDSFILNYKRSVVFLSAHTAPPLITLRLFFPSICTYELLILRCLVVRFSFNLFSFKVCWFFLSVSILVAGTTGC